MKYQIHRVLNISTSKTIFYKELINIKHTLVNNNFPNKLIDQQIKLYLQNIHKNNNTTRINLYYRNQMHYNYKLDKQAITNIIKRHIKLIKKHKQIKLIVFSKFKTSNLIIKNNINSAKIHLNQTNVVYKFICPFWECLPKNKNNSYIGYTTTMLSHRLTYHFSENRAIKQHLTIKHNSTNQLSSFDVKKILTDNTIIIYKNNNKKQLQILEAICIKNFKIKNQK